MRGQLSVSVLEAFWKSRFPGQIDPTLAVPEELAEPVIQLEGEELVSIPTGHTDTLGTTYLHVPSIGLVVAGDAVDNDVHIHLGESNADSRKEWIAALDMIDSLKPRAVIAGTRALAARMRRALLGKQDNTFATSTGSQQLPGPGRKCTT